MGHSIQLQTKHADNGAAIDELATVVDAEGLWLTHDESVPADEWVAFEVSLGDGSVFLEGMGRCEKSQATATGFSVRLTTLQFDPSNELIFERILLAKEDQDEGGRLTGEVDVGAMARADDSKSSPPVSGVPVDRPSHLSPLATPGPPVKPPPPLPKPKPSSPPPPLAAGLPRPSRPPPAQPRTPFVDPPSRTGVGEDTQSDMLVPQNLPADVLKDLKRVTARLVAEGRVRDLAEAHVLVLRVGLSALDPYLDD